LYLLQDLQSGFATIIFYAFVIPSMLAMCPACLSLLDFITGKMWWRVQVWSSSLCYILQPPVTSSCLSPFNHLNTLFSDTFNLFYTHTKQEVYYSFVYFICKF
jgi:hypothetical protein